MLFYCDDPNSSKFRITVFPISLALEIRANKFVHPIKIKSIGGVRFTKVTTLLVIFLMSTFLIKNSA